MRCITVSQIKGECRRLLSSEPAPGTKLRESWDLFKSSPGVPVEFSQGGFRATHIQTLTNNYGLDIRLVTRGYLDRKSTYVLAGEWFGRVYVDYIAERLSVTSGPTSPSAPDVSAAVVVPSSSATATAASQFKLER